MKIYCYNIDVLARTKFHAIALGEAVGIASGDGGALRGCHSELVVDTDARIVVAELQLLWQSEINNKCHALTPLIKGVFEVMGHNLGDPVVVNKIKELLGVLKSDKQKLKHGGATEISLKLVEDLEKLSSNPDYQSTLGGIKSTLQLIQFVGDVVSNEACGAYFTAITRAISGGAGQFLDAEHRKIVDTDTKMMEQYQTQVHTVWWEKCGLIISSTVSTTGAVVAAGVGAFTLNPALFVAAGTLLTIATGSLTKLASLQAPAVPKIQHVATDDAIIEARAALQSLEIDSTQGQVVELGGQAPVVLHVEEGHIS